MARKRTERPVDIAPKKHNDEPAIEKNEEVPAAPAATPRGPLKFVAVRACYYGRVNKKGDIREFVGKVYKTGDILEFVGPVTPCPQCTDGRKDGKTCLKCKGTGRIDPPHHFVPEDTSKAKIDEQSAEVEAAEIEDVRAKIRALGSDYDNRWTLPRLKQAYLSLTKMNRKGE